MPSPSVEPSSVESAGQSRLPLAVSAATMASLLGLYFFWPPFHDFVHQGYGILTSNDRPRISQWVSGFGFWGPLVIILAMIVQMFLLVIPSVALMVVAVLAYGPWWGSIIAVAAIVAASTVGYLIGRRLEPVTVDKLIGAKTQRQMESYVNRYGLWAVVIVRISPLLSNDAISLVAGLIRMKYWRFIAATVVGILPLTLLIAVLGRDTGHLKTGLAWISIISLVGFIAYVIHDQRKRR